MLFLTPAQMPGVKKGTDEVYEMYNGELVLNFKSCLSDTVITFNWLFLINI